MSKVRVYELAKELGLSNKDVIARLADLGIEVKSHSSTVTDEQAAQIRAGAGGAVDAVPRPEPQEIIPEEIIPPGSPRSASRPAARPAPEPMARPQPPTPSPTRGTVADRPSDARPEPAPAAPPRPEPVPEPEILREPEPVPEPVVVPVPEPTVEEVVVEVVDVAEEPEHAGIRVERGATVQEFAKLVDIPTNKVVKALMDLGEMKAATQSMTDDEIELVSEALRLDVRVVSVQEAEAEEVAEASEAAMADEADLESRPPVVTVMGHVDHGKTSILDVIRKTNVASREAGGITQHIGAYQARIDGKPLTFIDTPGHEAFTAMRARGARVTDIAVLVVAADDGVMPQTVEALNHAKAAGVPIVVAVNKIDKANADPQRVKQQLSEFDLIPADWGGETEFVEVSAKEDFNIDGLLETLAVVSELEDLKANPSVPAIGVTIEAHLDKGRGPVATIIVKQGTLRVGDPIVCGAAHGKVRAMLDENGKPLTAAGPSTPALILGFTTVPQAGDEFRVARDERSARQAAQERGEAERRAEYVASAKPALTFENLFDQVQAGEVNELVLILKADVQGSLEAVADALRKLDEKLALGEVKIKVIHRAVGAITDNDVRLAEASGGLILGFNVRPDAASRKLAEKEGVEIRTYRVIYELLEEVEAALKGMLEPEYQEFVTGQAEVRVLYRVPKIGVVCGCYVQDGSIFRNSKVRVLRDGAVVYEGGLASLKRFKEDVREVHQGYECGIGVENFQDVKEGDVIEAYEVREVAR